MYIIIYVLENIYDNLEFVFKTTCCGEHGKCIVFIYLNFLKV